MTLRSLWLCSVGSLVNVLLLARGEGRGGEVIFGEKKIRVFFFYFGVDFPFWGGSRWGVSHRTW